MTAVPATAVARRWPNRIRVLRIERGLSESELAALTGISRQALCRYELGRMVPGWRNAALVADALGVSVSDLGIAEQVRERREEEAASA